MQTYTPIKIVRECLTEVAHRFQSGIGMFGRELHVRMFGAEKPLKSVSGLVQVPL
jgi:hypothetical protein